MIKSTGSRRGWRGGRRIVLVGALAVVGAVILGSAGSASASSVACKAQIVPHDKKNPGIDADLKMQCNEELRGFSIVTNKTFDFFGTEVDITQPNGTPAQTSGTIQCTGNVPGPGFGCGTPNRGVSTGSTGQPGFTSTGCEALSGSAPGPQVIARTCNNRVDANDTIDVQVGFPQSPCKPTGQYAPGKDKLRAWVMALTEPMVGSFNAAWTNQNNTQFARATFISEPFKVGVKAYRGCASDGGGEESKGKKAAVSTDADGGLPRIW